ncbi:MAG: S24 family peptidase, partial [Acidiferrobacteraceae bacterium]|nr:S24 family peptidase [Acidiferrobacteraceae bacterium]
MSSCASNEPFALQVLGDSMAPEFKDGCVVIVEPGGSVCDGAFVVAEHGNGVIL